MLLGREPSFSVQFYKVMLAQLRGNDLDRCLEGLRIAGLPEWPFGYQGRPERASAQLKPEH